MNNRPRACLGPTLRAGLLAAVVGCTALTGASAQQLQLDAVSRQVIGNAFNQLQLQAFTLERADEVGQALEGLVRARLARDEVDKAIEITGRIDDNLWFGRAMMSISDHMTEVGDFAAALDFLNRAQARVDQAPETKERSEAYTALAIKRARLGNLEGGIAAASKIADASARVDALQNMANTYQRAAGYNKKARQAAAKVLRAAYDQVLKIARTDQGLINIYIAVGQAQVAAGDNAGAIRTYATARERATDGEDEGRNRSYANIAAAMTYAGNHTQAMEIVRLIPEGWEQGIALSAVARSMGQRGDIDAAVPMFILAKEQAAREEDIPTRYRLLARIVADETAVGRLADAFTTAGSIRERKPQSEALLQMGKILLDQERFQQAQTLLDYIPYVGMRAPIFAALAVHQGDQDNPTEASALLAKALEPTGFEPSLEHLPRALQSVLKAQLQVGDPEMDDAVFARAHELAFQIPESLNQVNALTYLASAEAQRGYMERANKTISSAWRIAWMNKKTPIYAMALANITQSQIAVGDILSAFDSAARIPDPTDEERNSRAADGSFRAPKFDALASVAAAAARDGETKLAIRAAKKIEHPSAHAAALAAIAVAVAAPDRTLREIIGTGPTDVRPYEILSLEAPPEVRPIGDLDLEAPAPAPAPSAGASAPAPAPESNGGANDPLPLAPPS